MPSIDILTDKENVSRKFLCIAMFRLGKQLTQTEKKIHQTPQMETTLKSLGSEFDNVVIVGLPIHWLLLVTMIWLILISKLSMNG